MALRERAKPNFGNPLKFRIEDFIAGGRPFSRTETAALHSYMRRFVLWKAEALENLAREIEALETRFDYADWFKRARLADLDPTD